MAALFESGPYRGPQVTTRLLWFSVSPCPLPSSVEKPAVLREADLAPCAAAGPILPPPCPLWSRGGWEHGQVGRRMSLEEPTPPR